MQIQKPLVKIEDWAVVSGAMSCGYQEAKPGTLLLGKVFGHPRMAEGAFVRSSTILSFDPHSGVVETCNTAYLLGKPNSACIESDQADERHHGVEVAA